MTEMGYGLERSLLLFILQVLSGGQPVAQDHMLQAIACNRFAKMRH